MQPDDATYWKSLIHGDPKALEKLYEQYFKILYNYGRKICLDASTVKDAINDLFIDLWRYRSRLSPAQSVRFYLYSSLRRKLVSRNSKITFTGIDNVTMEDVLQLASPSKESEIIESELHDSRVYQLKRLLNDLSPRQYEALVLFFYDEFTYEEIASLMSVNEQSVRNLIQRGLLQLRQHMKYIVSLMLFLPFNI